MSCVVPYYRSYSRLTKKTGGNTSFHRFPENNLRQKWIDAVEGSIIGRKKNTTVPMCSKHFKSDYFVIIKNRRHLIRDAIPTVFQRPLEGSHLNIQSESNNSKITLDDF